MTDLSGWPRTLWEIAGKACCARCGRSYSYHGASEIIATKLGFRLNQRHLVCRPPGDINRDSDSVGGFIMLDIDAMAYPERNKANP
jgi:hypothetical protein